MYAMRLAAYAPGGLLGFYWTTVALFCLAALVVAIGLERVAGMRALYFTATLALSVLGFMNWDLLGVAFGAVAVLAYLRRRDRLAAVAVGLGTAVKLFPALLAIPFVIGRVKEGDRRGAARLAIWSGGSWLVVNLPFAATAFSGWSRFFRFNSTRPADIDSLWYIACRDLAGRGTCVPTGLLDLLSVGFFVAGSVVIWRMKTARDPDIPAWTFGFPFLVVFFLTNKVYSPQYDLWLLMWFVLVLPDLRLFVALQLADLAIVVTRYAGFGSPPLWTFHSATLIRDAVLVACLVAFVRRPWQTQVGLVRPRSRTTSTSSDPGN
jgi:uncharacterized membrane protein